jgi:hypothetical protein
MSENTATSADRLVRHQALLDQARAANVGSRPWREFKLAGAAEVVRLAEQALRLEILDINFQGDLNLVYRIRMPVPRWPVDGKLVIGDSALFHLHFEEGWCEESPPGWAPLGLFQPHDPFHPNMRPSLRGAICLGKLPPGIPPIEILYLGYYAVSLQDHAMDETDPQGVLNAMACDYFRNHSEYLPLTRAGLLDPWGGAA